MDHLRFSSPAWRASREGPLLAAGLGLGALLSLGLWGLRPPVLVGALLPAGGAVVHWRGERRRRQAARLASADLLDPLVLEARLMGLAGPGFPPGPLLQHWRRSAQLLEEIRALIASCVRLAPEAAVPLLVLLEGLLDQLEPVRTHLRQPDGSLPPSLPFDRLQRCRDHLQFLLEQAQRDAQQHPGQSVWLPLDSLARL
jgi:hypothetical protein